MQVVLPLSEQPDKRSGAKPQQDLKKHPESGKRAEGVTGEALAIRKAPQEESVKKAMQAVVDKWGRIDVLVTAAG